MDPSGASLVGRWFAPRKSEEKTLLNPSSKQQKVRPDFSDRTFSLVWELAATLTQGYNSTHASGGQHQDAEHQAQLGVVTSLRHVALRLLGGLGLVGALRLVGGLRSLGGLGLVGGLGSATGGEAVH